MRDWGDGLVGRGYLDHDGRNATALGRRGFLRGRGGAELGGGGLSRDGWLFPVAECGGGGRVWDWRDHGGGGRKSGSCRNCERGQLRGGFRGVDWGELLPGGGNFG